MAPEVSTDPALIDIVVRRYDVRIRVGHRVAHDMISGANTKEATHSGTVMRSDRSAKRPLSTD
jgi:hypothetical protein